MSELARLADLYSARKPASMLALYERRLASRRTLPLRILEMGVYDGGSVRMWLDYFPRAFVAGLDTRQPPPIEGYGPRLRIYEGYQQDLGLLDQIAAEVAPAGFDLIVDDASHLGLPTKMAFWRLFDRHLRPGGLYAVEDWGTGFWDDWADGSRYQIHPEEVLTDGQLPRLFQSHQFGMVGFIKQLVDECHADAIKLRHNDPPGRGSKFAEMSIHAGIVFVEKAGP